MKKIDMFASHWDKFQIHPAKVSLEMMENNMCNIDTPYNLDICP